MHKKDSNMNSSSEGLFVSAEEINNIDFFSGKQLANGREEFSKTKQWTKSMKDIEEEQRYIREIISEIKRLESKIDIVLKKLELLEISDINMYKDNKKQTETLPTHNSTWKDKLKIW